MKTFFILSYSSFWSAALKRYLWWVHKTESHIVNIPPIEDSDSSLLISLEQICQSFEKFHHQIMRESVAILDVGLYEESSSLNPLRRTNIFAQLASMLSLAYPEIRWVFYSMKTPSDSHSWYWAEIFESVSRNFIFSSMFDSIGLRNLIRSNIKQDPELKELVMYLQERNKGISAAIDDEETYAYLHGYLSYKMGYRSFILTTHEMMDKLLKKDSEFSKNIQINLTFEDMFLNFPDSDFLDRTRVLHFSDLEERDEKYEKLKDAQKRIFVTVGHKYINWYYKNRNYMDFLRTQAEKIKIVYKPSGGIYNILENSELLREYWKWRNEEWKAAKPFPAGVETRGGHSAPGRLLVIAESLINRAENIFHKAETVPDCIHGATLSLEAQELLGYRTPTTCLEAIALRHKLEVKAECMFYGMEHNIDVKNRIKEIEKEVDVVAQWFNPKVKKRASLNAKMGIITDVMRIFKDFAQFDEEEQCLCYFRKLNRRWSLMQPGIKSIFSWVTFPIRWYVETLVGSLPLFILALLSWPLSLGVLSWLIKADFGKVNSGKPIIDGFYSHITHAYIAFFGLQTSGFPADPKTKILIVITILIGFVHLGIFISHLYTLITRK